MFEKVEHIGIAVANMEEACEKYTLLSGKPPYKREVVESEFVETAFFMMGDTKIELLAAQSESSAIHKFVQKKGEGMHHIAYDVKDIHAEMERLRTAGYRLLNEQPKEGADNKLICFIHPKDTGGVLTELCQEKN